jgi:hypothetical protein
VRCHAPLCITSTVAGTGKLPAIFSWTSQSQRRQFAVGYRVGGRTVSTVLYTESYMNISMYDPVNIPCEDDGKETCRHRGFQYEYFLTLLYSLVLSSVRGTRRESKWTCQS